MRPRGCLQLVIFFTAYIQSGTSVHDASSLVLGVLRVVDHNALLRWEGMPMDRVKDCVLNFSANHTDIWTILDYTPTNFTFRVPDLQPATFYKFVLVCHDNTNGKHTSQPVNFTTAYEGSTVGYVEPTHHSAHDDATSTPTLGRPQHPSRPQPVLSTLASTPNTGSRRPAAPPTTSPPSTPTPRSTAAAPTTAHTPGRARVTRRPGAGFGGAVLETETSPMDIGLGVAFGFIGCGVFAMMAYFCIKEYRRRLRIRRFLQYRRQENEPFPDMDNDDDEGIVP